MRLQSLYRGQRARRRVSRLVKAQYQVTTDPVTHATLYTNTKTQTSSWTKPALFATLGIGDADDDEDEDDDFDAFRAEAERDDDDDDDADNNDDDRSDSGESATTSKKKKRKTPRSKAQAQVDEAEDAGASGTELDLSDLNVWKLSSRIWNLQHLVKLVLRKNQLARIPSGIQDLVHLTDLDVSYNQLTRLPSCLQTTTTLTALNASHNRITAFSPKLWKLRALRRLDLSHNALATLPYIEGDLKLLRETREWQVGIGLLTSLQSLMLNHNRLSALPTSISKCAALEFLNLSNNSITELSDELTDLTALQSLYLHKNALATLPDALGNLARLEILEVKENRLVRVPESLGALERLQHLGLASNALTFLPEALGALSRLSRLDLDHNPHLVTLSVLFRRLPSIRTFGARGCGLARFETTAFLAASPVQALHLSANALTEFPLDVANAVMRETLEELVLQRNRLHAFPLDVARCCRELRTLDVSHNCLRSLPHELAHLVHLEALDVSHNDLETLPDTLPQLSQLKDVRCSHNRLTALPLALGKLTQLTHLDVSFNALATLPTSMTVLTALEALYANDNCLTRRPPALHHLPAACYCELSSNPFTADDCAVEQQRRQARADAERLLAAAQYEPAVAGFTALIETLEAQTHEVQRTQRPHLHFARGVCRFMLLQAATADVERLSAAVNECEQALHMHELLASRSTTRTRRLTKLQQEQEKEQERSTTRTSTHRLETDDTTQSVKTLTTSFSATAPLEPQDDETNNNSNSIEQSSDVDKTHSVIHEQYVHVAAARVDARERERVHADGALADFATAIRLLQIDCANSAAATEVLPTALFLLGRTHMARLEMDRAIERFTDALMLLVPRSSVPRETLDEIGDSRFASYRDRAQYLLFAPVSSHAVPIFLERARAYRLLGQVPAALADVRHVVTHHHSWTSSIDTLHPNQSTSVSHDLTSAKMVRVDDLDALEQAIQHEWDAQQHEYFVDAVATLRAFDVSRRSGLARRPQVLDLHRARSPREVAAMRSANAPSSSAAAGASSASVPKSVPLRPAARFLADVERVSRDLATQQATVRARMHETITARQRVLDRTRDFTREIRANLALEMEEAQQRAVERELARLAQVAREDREREFHEQLLMKYEDELTQWLVSEAQRLEREAQQRLDDAQRKAEAKAAYATRLARRGGRRQQAAAPRGAGSSSSSRRTASPSRK